MTSCNASSLWGLTKGEVLLSLARRDYSFIAPISPDSGKAHPYDEALALGGEAPYFLALHLAGAGRDADARAMFSLGARKGDSPFAELCLEELSKAGSPEDRLSAVESLLGRYGEAGGIAESRLRALEETRVALLFELGRSGEIPGGAVAWYGARAMSQALASAWPGLAASVPQFARAVIDCRLDVYRKSYREAWGKARPILESLAPNGNKGQSTGASASEAPRLTRNELSDFGKAALYGSVDRESDAAFFDRVASVAPDGEARYVLTFYAGRLYGRSSPKAADRFEAAMGIAPREADYDNALWYLLDAAQAKGTDELVQAIARYAPTWHDSALFSDIVDPCVAALAHGQEWKPLLALRLALSASTDRQTLARLDYLAARSNALGSDDAREAYEASFAGDHGALYYRVLSAERLGLPLGESGAQGFFAGRAASDSAARADRAGAALLRGLIEWRLEERVWPTVSESYPGISLSLARELSSALAERARYSDAIRVMSLAMRSSDAPISDEDLRAIYPRPWLSEVRAASARFGVPEYLLYALIRSESYFQSDAVSAAGAIGLTQLMKPTASDVAGKLKIDSFDLFDPSTNITFGAAYLSELIDRLDGRKLDAFFAYNAGITRVREWRKSAMGSAPSRALTADLFLEGLPFSETREYGRKVIAAAAVYGYLYYQKPTEQTVRELF